MARDEVEAAWMPKCSFRSCSRVDRQQTHPSSNPRINDDLDTHVVVWLHAEGAARLSPRAADEVERAGEILCSPMVRLEVQHLFEIGLVSEPAGDVLDALSTALGLRMCDLPFFGVVREAERQTWTRDPFDRLIVAQASLGGASLITKDETIHVAYPQTVW